MTIIAMHVVNMCGRVLTVYCVGDCHMNVPAITPRVHAGLDLTRLSTGVFHPGLYGDNVCMFVI